MQLINGALFLNAAALFIIIFFFPLSGLATGKTHFTTICALG